MINRLWRMALRFFLPVGAGVLLVISAPAGGAFALIALAFVGLLASRMPWWVRRVAQGLILGSLCRMAAGKDSGAPAASGFAYIQAWLRWFVNWITALFGSLFGNLGVTLGGGIGSTAPSYGDDGVVAPPDSFDDGGAAPEYPPFNGGGITPLPPPADPEIFGGWPPGDPLPPGQGPYDWWQSWPEGRVY